MNKFAFAALLATLVAAPAFANNTGASVTGSLSFGPNGAYGGQYWATPDTTIGSGVEYVYQDGANEDTADFSATQLTITDQVFTNANGWQMSFTTPDGFSGLSLVSSDFAPGVTYSDAGGTVTVDWAGTNSGGATYTAVFDVAAVSAVPEAANVAMMLAGLGLMGFVARRRKA